MKIFSKVALRFWQQFFGSSQTLARLFQKFVRFAIQCFGNADETGQGKIVFGAFNAADKCPVHISAFGKRFLRQSHLLPKGTHVFCQSLAILVVHARQVWEKKSPENIDVKSIAFDTRQPYRILAFFDLSQDIRRVWSCGEARGRAASSNVSKKLQEISGLTKPETLHRHLHQAVLAVKNLWVWV